LQHLASIRGLFSVSALQKPRHCKFFVLFYNTATKCVSPVVEATTLLFEVDVIWVGVVDISVIIVFEDSSKVRDRLRVRNLKITRTPSFEIPRLCSILPLLAD